MARKAQAAVIKVRQGQVQLQEKKELSGNGATKTAKKGMWPFSVHF